MCCLLAILGLFGPRVAFFFVWLLTNRVTLAFHDRFVVPLLGLIFLPWTALLYTLAYAPGRGVTGVGWVLVAIGLLVDVSSWASGPFGRRRGRW